MPLDPSLIKVYPPANVPNPSGASGGDINTGAGVLSETTNNVLIPALPVPPAADPEEDPYHYARCFKNENVGIHLLLPYFWILNGLKKPVAQGTFTITPASADETGKVRLHFLSGGDWIYEDVTLDGQTPITTSEQGDADTDVFVEKLTSGGALTTPVGNIWIARDITLGRLAVVGAKAYATSCTFHRLGLDPSVNNTLQTADRQTPPAGVTYAEAYDYASAIQIAGPDDLQATEFVKAWTETRMPPGFGQDLDVPPQDYGQPVVAWRGTSS